MTVKELFTYRIFTFSNILSLSRIFLIPFLFYYIAYDHPPENIKLYPAIIVAIMVLTDYLDGYLARKLGQETPLGQYLDPVADKLVILSGLFLLYLYRDFPLWLVLFITAREVAGTIGGGYLLIKRNVLGKPNYWGKVGVGTIALAGFFYLLRWPYKEYTLIPVMIVFTGGIAAYAKTYWRTLFKKPIL